MGADRAQQFRRNHQKGRFGCLESSDDDREGDVSSEKIPPKKLEAGRSVMGVEGFPKTDCPLDPEPGLGGIVSLGLLRGKSSSFLASIPVS